MAVVRHNLEESAMSDKSPHKIVKKAASTLKEKRVAKKAKKDVATERARRDGA